MKNQRFLNRSQDFFTLSAGLRILFYAYHGLAPEAIHLVSPPGVKKGVRPIAFHSRKDLFPSRFSKAPLIMRYLKANRIN